MNRARPNLNRDFTCQHCRRFVSSSPLVAGANNRNHCPSCLWSRHLDLWQPGDRLSACKGGMRPVGLTFKVTRKKYGSGRGELMVAHVCNACGKLSLNRIAADDDAETLLRLLEHPRSIDAPTAQVVLLSPREREMVQQQLYGLEV